MATEPATLVKGREKTVTFTVSVGGAPPPGSLAIYRQGKKNVKVCDLVSVPTTAEGTSLQCSASMTEESLGAIVFYAGARNGKWLFASTELRVWS